MRCGCNRVQSSRFGHNQNHGLEAQGAKSFPTPYIAYANTFILSEQLMFKFPLAAIGCIADHNADGLQAVPDGIGGSPLFLLAQVIP